jgi:predicted regulator of Ras-like GTPase activity (Roadblock/LC7/MglB family)
MRAGLREINDLQGVWGSFLANNQGEIILSAAPPDLNKPVLESISSQIIEVLDSSSEGIEGLSEIVFHFDQKKLFVVDLEKVILAVICTPSVDVSLLRMTVNVVRTTWEDDAKVQVTFEKNFTERS